MGCRNYMSRDDSTFLPTEQDSSSNPEKDSVLYLLAARCRKYSQDFGWPSLVLLLVGPGDPIDRSEVFYYFFLAAPIAFSALLLRLMSQGYDRKKYFVVTGPYRYVRNPVELGTLLGYGAAGTALSLPAWYTTLIILIAALYMSFISISYERGLRRQFGTAFIKYASRVRRWIPLGLPATNPSTQDYSFQLAVLNEKWTWVWLLGFLFVYAFRQRLA
jgi:hypothetical protein